MTQSESTARQGTLVAFRPRLSVHADTMYQPSLDNLVITEGHTVRPWVQRHDQEVTHRLVSILGQYTSAAVAPGTQLLDMRDKDGVLDMDPVRRLAYTGSYIAPKGQKKPELTVAYEDDNAYYLIWSSGFMPTEVEVEVPGRRKPKIGIVTEPDFIELTRRGIQPVAHGFHTLGGANSVLACEAGIEFTGPESKRLWTAVGRDRVLQTDIPHYRNDLIRIEKHGGGGQGVFRDIDGTVGKIVIKKGKIAVVSATPQDLKFFDLAEDRRRRAATLRRAQRRAEQDAKAASVTNVPVVAEPVADGETFKVADSVEIPTEEAPQQVAA